METAVPEAAFASLDNKNQLMHFKDQDGNVTINGSVPYAGNYIIVAHYHQPSNPSKWLLRQSS